MASDCCQPPAECRSPAGYLTKTQEFGCTPKPRVSAQVHLFARLAHLHYPLSLTTHDVSLCRYPRGTRTRETGLAWYKAPGRYFIRLGQARARTAGSECCSLSPESLCPNVYTIHIVKELFGELKKTPVGSNQPGFLTWSFPGRFDVRAFQKPFKEGLRHRFPTIRGEHINTVKRHRRGYAAQA